MNIERRIQKRTKIVSFLALLFVLLILTNFFMMQIIHGDEYKDRASHQYISSKNGFFERGNIFIETKDKELITIAGLEFGYKVSINPRNIDEPELLFNKIKNLIDLDRDSFINIASKDDPYEEIATRLDKEAADKIRELAGRNVQIYREKWRTYPMGEMAAQSVGFIAYKGDKLAGRYGLERQYDDVLDHNNNNLQINFFAEIFSNLQKLRKGETFRGDIVTNIEPSVQIFLENELKKTYDKWNSERIGGIIINPKNGEIYGMASIPSFNIDNFRNENPQNFKNPIIENVYEMGSVIKPLIMALALDKEVVNAKTSFYDHGFVKVGKHTIYNFDKKGRGNVNMQDVLSKSLNTGMVFVMNKLKKEDLRNYFKSIGLYNKTGIDLPNEALNLTSNLKSKRDIEFANIAFGQGIALSPISIVKALSFLSNGGYPITPHLVKEIKYRSGIDRKIEYKNILDYKKEDSVFKKESSEEISRMLIEVFDLMVDGKYKLDNYSIAAKTGTAQIPSPDGSYYENRHLHSFFGYFPAYDPDFLIFLFMEYPKKVRYASETLTDPFVDISNFLINYYDVIPDRI